MTIHIPGGGCSCGRTRYQLTASVLIVHACHCRMCQRLTGGSNAVNVLVEAENAKLLSGETIDVLADTPSGNGQLITRCGTCFATIWSDYRSFSGRYGLAVRFVRAGTLDAPEHFPPDVHIFTKSMQPHASPADGKPQFRSFYDPQKVWPADSLTRLRAGARTAKTATVHADVAEPTKPGRKRVPLAPAISRKEPLQ